MNQKPIAPGAVGVLMIDLPGNFEGRLWRVDRLDPETKFWHAMVAVQAVDMLDDELQIPSWYVPARRFWCLLDAGVLEL